MRGRAVPSRPAPLAEAVVDGQGSGQGIVPGAPVKDAGVGVGGGPGYVDGSGTDPNTLLRPLGVPRAQRGGAFMGVSPEYGEYPRNTGAHDEITNRPQVTIGPVRMLPWEGPQRPSFRTPPVTDAANAPTCENAGRS